MGSFVAMLSAAECKERGIEPTPLPAPIQSKMPEKVFVLKASDIKKGDTYNSTSKKHDLTGWRDTQLNLGNKASDPRDKVLVKFTKTIRKEISKVDISFGEHEGMASWSDLHTGAEVAAVWNSAMKALGYGEDGELVKRPRASRKKAV